MARRKNEFDAFMREVEAEAKARGELHDLAFCAAQFRLARLLIELREKAGWTQQQLAKRTGVQQSEISRIERGQGNPALHTLEALAHSGRMTVSFVSARTVRLRPRKPVGRRRSL